jgi:nitrite reductase (NO-forming)
MRRVLIPAFVAVILSWAVTAVLLTQNAIAHRGSSQDGSAAADEKVFGSPPATVFHEDYNGPPVTGRNVTHVPALAPLQPGTRTHDVRIDIVPAEIDIAPGVRYQAWTFGGSVPGPVVHVREGDRVVFTMKNRSDAKVTVTEPSAGASPFLVDLARDQLQKATPVAAAMHHSIDFHAGTVAPDDKWRMVMPGESIRFEWVANYPGVFLYHCGAPPILMHLAMGQYGVVVVSPRRGFPTDERVDREYVVVQSEFYLKPGGVNGLHVLDFDAAMDKRPSQVAFNGHTQALTSAPLVANAGERVRIDFHNVGPSDGSSFHVVGAIFDRVFYEGNPRNEWTGMQTVPFGASNGGVVELVAPEEGTYVLVDHEFADARVARWVICRCAHAPDRSRRICRRCGTSEAAPQIIEAPRLARTHCLITPRWRADGFDRNTLTQCSEWSRSRPLERPCRELVAIAGDPTATARLEHCFRIRTIIVTPQGVLTLTPPRWHTACDPGSRGCTYESSRILCNARGTYPQDR